MTFTNINVFKSQHKYHAHSRKQYEAKTLAIGPAVIMFTKLKWYP